MTGCLTAFVVLLAVIAVVVLLGLTVIAAYPVLAFLFAVCVAVVALVKRILGLGGGEE